jgi:hypothetical protein
MHHPASLQAVRFGAALFFFHVIVLAERPIFSIASTANQDSISVWSDGS